MFPVNQFPYTNFHELNLDWILAEIKQLREIVEGGAAPGGNLEARVAALEKSMLQVMEQVAEILNGVTAASEAVDAINRTAV